MTSKEAQGRAEGSSLRMPKAEGSRPAPPARPPAMRGGCFLARDSESGQYATLVEPPSGSCAEAVPSLCPPTLSGCLRTAAMALPPSFVGMLRHLIGSASGASRRGKVGQTRCPPGKRALLEDSAWPGSEAERHFGVGSPSTCSRAEPILGGSILTREVV